MSDSDSSSDKGDENPSVSNKLIKKTKYSQTYKEQWENIPEFRGWLCKSKKGNSFAKCSACEKDINIISGKDALTKHSISKVHETKVKSIQKQKTLTSFVTAGSSNQKLEDNIKQGEIRLSAFIAEHNLPFAAIDHLVKVVAAACPDSKIAQGMACSRSKCTAVVKHVLGQHGLNELCLHLQNNNFSLIVDESTDRSNIKHLCLVARSFRNNTIKDDFLGLIKLTGADANTLYKHIIDFFNAHKIPFKNNLIGFASDGANVMMGEHHSLMTLLKNDVPSLFVLKCICHSFHLCASYACKKLPRFVEDMIRDVFNYFSSSPKRVSELAEFQEFCNVKVQKMLHPSQTRWLSVHAAVVRILEQYGALTLFFTDAVSKKDLLASENILKKLNDPTTKLFLNFLDFILPFFNNLNKEMQSESPKIHVLFKNVCNVLRSLFDCFIKRNYLLSTSIKDVQFKNPNNYLPLEEMYYGGNTMKIITELHISSEQLHFFRLRCLDFFVESCSQVLQRFPLTNSILEKFNFVDPSVVKSGSVQSIVDIALLVPHLTNTSNLQPLDNEWRLLRNTEEIQSYSNDVIEFWQDIKKIKMGDGTPAFKILCDFVENIFCLPCSSANVERMFSQINLVKTNQRNSVETDTTAGLLYTKAYIGDKCCFDFPIDKKLVLSMNSKNLYKN